MSAETRNKVREAENKLYEYLQGGGGAPRMRKSVQGAYEDPYTLHTGPDQGPGMIRKAIHSEASQMLTRSPRRGPKLPSVLRFAFNQPPLCR